MGSGRPAPSLITTSDQARRTPPIASGICMCCSLETSSDQKFRHGIGYDMYICNRTSSLTNHVSRRFRFFLRQLPPCTSRAPFIISPDVINTFDFRVLRQNRRVIKEAGREQELEEFHEILQSISMGDTTDSVRKFLVEAYVRGASVGCAENVQLEGSTAVFTKRRYRDAWNRTVLRRVAKNHAHTLKIRAKVKSKGSESFFGQRRSNWVRSKARTQALWSLHLAGQRNTYDKTNSRTNNH